MKKQLEKFKGLSWRKGYCQGVDDTKMLTKKDIEIIANDIQKIIKKSKAAFKEELLYELKETISNNVAMYFYNKLKDEK